MPQEWRGSDKVRAGQIFLLSFYMASDQMELPMTLTMVRYTWPIPSQTISL